MPLFLRRIILKEFQIITLCNTVYKIIMKVLVNRLCPLLNDLIGPFQSSFLPVRGALIIAIVLQEIINSMHKSKKKNGDVAYKIDLEKAYDHVDWIYLKTCLQDFGFTAITVKLIMHCVTSSSLSLLWNGQRLPNFMPIRGLRQRSPLSPYLFVLYMEKLSLVITEAVNERRWFKVAMNGPCVSHLFFENGVPLFTKAKSSQARLLPSIFENFSKVSWLKVNISKFGAFFSSGVTRNKADKFTSITSTRSTTSLDKYLGSQF